MHAFREEAEELATQTTMMMVPCLLSRRQNEINDHQEGGESHILAMKSAHVVPA